MPSVLLPPMECEMILVSSWFRVERDIGFVFGAEITPTKLFEYQKVDSTPYAGRSPPFAQGRIPCNTRSFDQYSSTLQMRKLSLCWGNWVREQDSLVTCAQWQLCNSQQAVPPTQCRFSLFPLLFRSLQAQNRGDQAGGE